MLNSICPKLPMRNKEETSAYYLKMGFKIIGDYGNYILIKKDEIEIHFFEFVALVAAENYGQVYIRTNSIDDFHQELIANGVKIHPNGGLKTQPWGQKEFSLLDPDFNLLTFGEAI